MAKLDCKVMDSVKDCFLQLKEIFIFACVLPVALTDKCRKIKRCHEGTFFGFRTWSTDVIEFHTLYTRRFGRVLRLSLCPRIRCDLNSQVFLNLFRDPFDTTGEEDDREYDERESKENDEGKLP